MKKLPALLLALLVPALHAAPAAGLHEIVAGKIDADYASLNALYQDLHRHPELSLMEVQTAPLAAAMPALKPSAQPMLTPVRPTPMATDRPFSIWARNTAKETEREKDAILSGESGELC